MLSEQSNKLLSEWNATAVEMVNPNYCLSSERCTQVAEVFDGKHYSRIHRRTNDILILEQRTVGNMYPMCWKLTQNFDDLEKMLLEKINLSN